MAIDNRWLRCRRAGPKEVFLERIHAAETKPKFTGGKVNIKAEADPGVDLADLPARIGRDATAKPISDARDEAGLGARVFEYYAGAITKFCGQTIPVSRGGFDFTLPRRPAPGVLPPWFHARRIALRIKRVKLN